MVLPPPKFFLRINLGAEALTRWALVAAAMLIVLWIRTLPLTIPAAGDLAERIVARNVREQIAPQVMRQVPGEAWRNHVEDAAQEWIKRHQAEYDAARASVAAEVKSDFTFKAEDGRKYVYLGDYDSYVWLRNARNYLSRGTTCDAITNGECRDTYGNAPVGYRMVYNRSLHTAAIVAVHRAITFFHPDYPLSASSFLVPVLLGMLGVLPAFFLGRRVGGDLGGVFAAVIISLYPPFLLRSVGSDNDVWNVVLPLFAAWAMAAALDGGKIVRAASWAIAAGALTTMHAAVWRGWLFTYGLLLSAALGHALLVAAREAARRGWRQMWRADQVRLLTCVVLAYYVSVGVFTWLAGESAFSVPFRMLASAAGFAGNTNDAALAGNLWPQALKTVTELGRPKPRDVVLFMDGLLYFFSGWLGLLALVLPKSRWRPRHFVLIVWTVALYAVCFYLFAWSAVPRRALLLLFGLPLAAELLARSFNKNSAEQTEPDCVLVLVWFFAALYLVHDGIRFLILFVVPFGLAFGVAADRFRQWLETRLQRVARRYASLAGAASLAVVLAVLVYPFLLGYTTMKTYYPAMNSAWWNSLVKIRDGSRPDAIVNSWWDYGYWIKYVAERRVSSDGGSLRTHVPHWLAKALLAPSDAETLGILRMLNCGSDATPLPEGARGAYGKLRAMGLDEVTAYSFLGELLGIGRAEAQRYLAGQGFTAEQQSNVLASTHCRPPESFLILSRETLGQWLRLGSWDLRRAYLVFRTRLLPEEQAVEQMVKRFGYTREQAERMYLRLSAMKSDAERKVFVAPLLRVIPGEWERCRGAGIGSEMRCRIAFTDAGGATTFMDFLYDSAAPKEGRLKDGAREGAPGVVVVAREWGLEDNAAPAPEFPDIGVLLDPAGERVLVGTPFLIRSTLVRLIYLDERYTKHFRRFDQKTTPLGDEVMTWKIDWND
jgi:oligosaccharyl transferase STT3 subunit